MTTTVYISTRQREVLFHLSQGKSPQEIAAIIGFSIDVVQDDMAGAAVLLGSRTREHMMRLAFQYGVLQLHPATDKVVVVDPKLGSPARRRVTADQLAVACAALLRGAGITEAARQAGVHHSTVLRRLDVETLQNEAARNDLSGDRNSHNSALQR